MKLNINKACDLSSISVLPPHSRRSNPISSGVDCSGSGKIQPSQLRSQSQPPFSQGTSLSQLSQGSLDEVLTNEQAIWSSRSSNSYEQSSKSRFGSQERENSARRLSCLAPIRSSRDESQMQLSKLSDNAMWRTNPASAPDQRCHVSEELEHRIGLVESSLNRLGRILDNIQGDVMKVNKAVKEVSLEMEGIRQRTMVQDNHLQLMLKEEEDIKANLVGILKSIPDQLRKEAESADQHKLHIISSAISSLSARFEARLLKLQKEICGSFTKEMEKRSNIAAGSQKNQMSTTGISRNKRASGQPVKIPTQKRETKVAKLLKPESFPFSNAKHCMEPKQEDVLLAGQANSLVMESDDEIDGGFHCLLEKRETGWKSCLSEEARVESMRILKKARRRKKKLNSTVVLD